MSLIICRGDPPVVAPVRAGTGACPYKKNYMRRVIMSRLILFESKQVRRVWNEQNQKRKEMKP
jgi:hypothetical protein